MYGVKQAAEQAAERLGLPVEFTRMHADAGYHVCVDGRHYTNNCLVTDPDCDRIVRHRMRLDPCTIAVAHDATQCNGYHLDDSDP